MTLQTLSPSYLINGRSDAVISPLDRGFAYGDGIFRTMKIRDGLPVLWSQHYAKLVEDCNVLRIVCPSADILLADIRQLFSTDQNGVAKIMVTRGEAARGYALPALAQPTRVVIKASLPNYPTGYEQEGVGLHLCQLRLPEQPAYAGIKHLNRLENVMARMEWSDAAYADGLLLDTAGNVIECTMSNLFARYGSDLVTPDLTKCGVAGITRQQILDLAPRLGLNANVAQLSLEKLLQADEVIICNSLYGAWQVRSVAGADWGKQHTAAQLRTLINEMP